jgi:hypothetical protein
MSDTHAEPTASSDLNTLIRAYDGRPPVELVHAIMVKHKVGRPSDEVPTITLAEVPRLSKAQTEALIAGNLRLVD